MSKQSSNKILIYGSCVTRDPIELLLADDAIRLEKYLSKTAITSQMANKGLFPHAVPDETDFGSRMIQHDINKDIVAQITSSDFDFMILDFVDERLPILRIGDSMYTGSRFFIDEYKRKRPAATVLTA